MGMSKRRLEATLAGDLVDRPAVAFWRHFYDLEQTTDRLVQAMVAFQRRFDWDFLKINPRACYHFQDWGNRYTFASDGSDAPRCVERRIHQPADWASLETLDPAAGVIGEHVGAVRRIRAELGPDTPMIMTVFTPLAIAAELAGNDALTQHMSSHAELVHAGLKTITDTLAAVTESFFDTGIDGIFYATRQWGSRDVVSGSHYDTFGKPYDLQLMELMQRRGWFNIFHVCGSNNMLLDLLDLPAHCLNWDAADPTNPSLADARQHTDRTLIGGLDAGRLKQDGPGDWLDAQLRNAQAGAGPSRWIVGAGCTTPVSISEQQLDAVRDAVERL